MPKKSQTTKKEEDKWQKLAAELKQECGEACLVSLRMEYKREDAQALRKKLYELKGRLRWDDGNAMSGITRHRSLLVTVHPTKLAEIRKIPEVIAMEEAGITRIADFI